jgi:hypothetical protein
MVVKLLILVFWVAMPCGLVGRYQYCFGGTHSFTMQKTNIGNYNFPYAYI